MLRTGSCPNEEKKDGCRSQLISGVDFPRPVEWLLAKGSSMGSPVPVSSTVSQDFTRIFEQLDATLLYALCCVENDGFDDGDIRSERVG